MTLAFWVWCLFRGHYIPGARWCYSTWWTDRRMKDWMSANIISASISLNRREEVHKILKNRNVYERRVALPLLATTGLYNSKLAKALTASGYWVLSVWLKLLLKENSRWLSVYLHNLCWWLLWCKRHTRIWRWWTWGSDTVKKWK